MVAVFFKHQAFSILAGPLLAFLCVIPINIFGSLFRPFTEGLAGHFSELLVCAGTVVVGYLLPNSGDGEQQIARWVWIAPCFIFIVLFSWEWADFGFKIAANAFFRAEPPSGEGVATIIFTFPVVSAIGYSLGAALAVWNSKSKDLE